jgi:hypothetical protein
MAWPPVFDDVEQARDALHVAALVNVPDPLGSFEMGLCCVLRHAFSSCAEVYVVKKHKQKQETRAKHWENAATVEWQARKNAHESASRRKPAPHLGMRMSTTS